MTDIIIHNNNVRNLMQSQRRADGQIADGIYVAAMYNSDSGILTDLYLGGRHVGPMLQYVADGSNAYDGVTHHDYCDGRWTPLYSRGDFGRRYAFGGHWSGQARCLHPRIGDQERHDRVTQVLPLPNDGGLITLPRGICGGLTLTDIDCSIAWSIWYPTALAALDARLTREEIAEAALPAKSIQHLLATESQDILDRLRDVITAFNL